MVDELQYKTYHITRCVLHFQWIRWSIFSLSLFCSSSSPFFDRCLGLFCRNKRNRSSVSVKNFLMYPSNINISTDIRMQFIKPSDQSGKFWYNNPRIWCVMCDAIWSLILLLFFFYSCFLLRAFRWIKRKQSKKKHTKKDSTIWMCVSECLHLANIF